MHNYETLYKREQTKRRYKDALIAGRVKPSMLGINNLAGFGAGGEIPVTDPNFSSVKLLMHMNGANGSTTFTDVKAHSFTGSGNAQISTAASKFGGASFLDDGTGDYVSAAESADWAIGTGDFTLEFWMNPVTLSASALYLYDQYSSSLVRQLAVRCSSTVLECVVVGSPVYSQNHTGGTGIANGTWRHIAVCRNGTNLRVFVEGTQLGATVTNSANILAGSCYLGIRTDSLTLGWNGYIDEIRLTVGYARYTANFTPAVVAFPDS